MNLSCMGHQGGSRSTQNQCVAPLQVIVAESFGGNDEPVDTLMANLVGVGAEVSAGLYASSEGFGTSSGWFTGAATGRSHARLGWCGFACTNTSAATCRTCRDCVLPCGTAPHGVSLAEPWTPCDLERFWRARSDTGQQLQCYMSASFVVVLCSYWVLIHDSVVLQVMGDALRIKEVPTNQLYQGFEEAGTDLAQVCWVGV